MLRTDNGQPVRRLVVSSRCNHKTAQRAGVWYDEPGPPIAAAAEIKTMYVPHLFGSASPEQVQEVVEQYSFATLTTVGDGELQISHLPLALQGTLADGVLRGHMARANPQLAHARGRATAIFHGPHAYISPGWYAQPGVPTWNYITVHCHGSLQLEDTTAALEDALEVMLDKYESADGRRSIDGLSPNQRARALAAIQSFSIKIERVEAKFKLSQNKSAEDRARVIEQLSRSDSNADLVQWMARQGVPPS
jgi:transcriptional regulator